MLTTDVSNGRFLVAPTSLGMTASLYLAQLVNLVFQLAYVNMLQ